MCFFVSYYIHRGCGHCERDGALEGALQGFSMQDRHCILYGHYGVPRSNWDDLLWDKTSQYILFLLTTYRDIYSTFQGCPSFI